nr:CCR4 NOT transcription complex subunit 1 [Hymenolepis microstoma]
MEEEDFSLNSFFAFLVSDVDKENAWRKSQELGLSLTPDLVPEFLEYLINKCIIRDTNHLDALADMLRYLGNVFSEIQDLAIPIVVNATKAIFAHLPSDNTISIKREYLKNLGRFLGLLTIVRGRLVTDSVLDLKSLLLEAIDRGNSALLYVVPFVSSFFKCVPLSDFPTYCTYNTRIFKILSWLYHRDGVNKHVKFEIEAMFKELRIEIIEPEKDSKICSSVKQFYVGFDGDLNANERSLLPRLPELSSQNVADTNVAVSFQTPTAQRVLPSVGRHVRQQMEQRTPVNVIQRLISTLNSLRLQVTDEFEMELQRKLIPILSSYLRIHFSLPQSSNLIQQFNQTRQPLCQDMPSINDDDNSLREIDYDEITSALNIQEILKTLESQYSSLSLRVNPTLLNETIRFLSGYNAKGIISFSIIKFIMEVIGVDSKSVIINSIINSVINAAQSTFLRNGIPENLFEAAESQTIEATSSHLRHLMEGTYSKLLTDHIVLTMCNVGFQNPIVGEFVAGLVKMQMFKKLYSFFFSVMGREALEGVKNKLLTLFPRGQHEPQPYSIHSPPDLFENARRVERSQRMPNEQTVLSNTQQHMTQMHSNHPRETDTIDLPSQSGSTVPLGNIKDLVQKIYDEQMADSEIQCHLQQQRTAVYPNSPQMEDFRSMSLRRETSALTSKQKDTIDYEQYRVQFVCSKLIEFIDKIASITTLGPTLTMLAMIKRYAMNAVTCISSAKVTIWGSIVCCIISSFLKHYDTSKGDAANEDQKHIYLFTLKFMCNLTRAEFIQAAVFTGWYFEVELEKNKGEIGTFNESIWNWKAFAELLRQNLVDLDMFDHYLSINIERNFIDYVEFFLNLLDLFILPAVFDNRLGELGEDCTEILSTNFGPIKIIALKRDFMALNEFDLWKSIRSFGKFQLSIPIAVDFIRIHTSYARIRALMDWGLFESDEVQAKFPMDNAEYQVLFKEISKSQIRNRWSEDKAKLHEVFNIWYEFYQSCSSISRKTLACVTKCMRTVFPNGKSDKEEDFIHFFRALINEIVDDFTVGESRNLGTVSLDEGEQLESLSEAFGEFLALSILTAPTMHKKINKLKLLCHFLGVIGRKIIFMHEESKGEFNPLPLKGILVRLLRTLLKTQHDPLFDPIRREPVPVAFGYLLHLLRPSRVPVFQVVFLEFLEIDVFMKWMLENGTLAYHNIYAQLLVDVTKHVSILAQNFITRNSFTNLYQSLHDLWNKLSCLYPTFVCEFAHYFSTFIALPLFDLRNLVISARNDQTSFTGLLKPDALKSRLDSLPDPTGYAMQANQRLPSALKSAVESYASIGAPVDFLETLPYMLHASDSIVHLLLSPKKLEMTQDKFGPNSLLHKALYYAAVNSQNLADYGFTNSLPYIPDLVSDFLVYLCIVSIENCKYLGDGAGEFLMERLPLMPIVKSLLKGVGSAGQYFIISCMVRQLRYLNKHTKFFAQYLLQIFKLEAKDEDLRCDIFRCLFEYLLTKEPKSEGILITCAEIFLNFECNLDASAIPKLSEDLERAVKNICLTYIPEIKSNPSMLPNGNSDSNLTLTPDEEQRD